MHFAQIRGFEAKVSDTDVDGRCLRAAGDPTDQRSVYILPGDTKRETYRLSTFKDFPQHVRVNTCRLAASGFYYTGFSDRVKCFSCGLVVDSWVIGDVPESRDWHEDHCAFINGTDESNIPILSLVQRARREIVQLPRTRGPGFETKPPRTDSRPNSPGQVTAGEVVNSGPSVSSTTLGGSFFQTARVTAPRLSAPPSVAASTAAGEDTTSRFGGETRNREQNLRRLFPCLNPINPHMRNRAARLQTFLDHSSTWPSHRIRATPEDIAEAGMYCLGERDRAKCWYCNGGLQNWEWNDDPWLEHAKWFPMCEFVLQHKGPEYVHEIVARFPNLRRPTLQNPASSTQASRLAGVPVPGASSSSSSSTSRVGYGPEIIDPREEMWNINKQIEKDMMTSGLVSQAREMGFEDREIREALKRKYELSTHNFSDFGSLVEAIVSITEEENYSELDKDTRSTNNSSPFSSLGGRQALDSSLQELQRLEESGLCKICRNQKSCMVFIPCGHLVCCIDCGQKAKKCPVCKTFIREKFRSYLS